MSIVEGYAGAGAELVLDGTMSSADVQRFDGGQPLRDLHSVSSYAHSPAYVLTTGSVQTDAAFTSTDAGRVTFDQQLSVVSDHAGEDLHTVAGWTYNFTAEFDGRFSFDFTSAGAGVTNGLGKVGVQIFDADFGHIFNMEANAYGAGPATRRLSGDYDLTAGRTYIAMVYVGSFLQSPPGLHGIDGQELSTFDWRITANPASAAPEPQAWALLILGLAGTGGALRRSRARAAAS